MSITDGVNPSTSSRTHTHSARIDLEKLNARIFLSNFIPPAKKTKNEKNLTKNVAKIIASTFNG